MVGRGGGRGGGGRMGEGILGVGETVPGPCLKPAPTYPLLEHHPTPLTVSHLSLAQLATKVNFLSHLSRQVADLNYPWEYFPAELRPGLRKRPASEVSATKTKPPANIDELLAVLEKNETAGVKKEVEDERGEGGEEEDFEDSDEEMDDGTDYNQNYFDNGEGYDDEDDDRDDGPTY